MVDEIVIGQSRMTDVIIYSLFCGGNTLITGVPGLGKTLTVHTIAALLDLDFRRIQFTPDLMPSDITGSDVLEEDALTGKREFRFIKGPVFANIILADEINRTPPKTQAALLEAMQERQVTASGKTFKLSEPFFVMATQNPIEQEGTYPLPEAELDRFMFSYNMDYPTSADEARITLETTAERKIKITPILGKQDLEKFKKLIERIPVSSDLINKAVEVTGLTRPKNSRLDWVKKYILWGAGTRACQNLIFGAKARAACENRPTPDEEDLFYFLDFVLRHRIVLSFAAEAEQVTQEDILGMLKKEFKRR
ncbi:AAA family ATPase [candidate division WOR-3 bacterium]|nr:AAA family ATPase [candidate division WOR-3 bacterium]